MSDRALLVSLVLALSATAPTAADFVVVPGQSIQAAIDQAVDGDRVLIQPGFYVESLDLQGKAIELVGVGGAAQTTIGGAGVGIRLHQGEDAGTRIRGLTIEGCATSTDYGAGISGFVPGGPTSTALIEDCVIRSNFTFYGRGGGVAGDLTMRRCVIAENSSGTFSGFGGAGGVYGAPTMIECAVLNNSVTKGAYGGVFLTGSKPAFLIDCLIAGNLSYNVGGGVGVDVGVTATIQNCVIARNELIGACLGYCAPGGPPATYGVAVAAYGGSSVVIQGSTLVDNIGHASGGGEPSIGVYGAVVVQDSILRGNTGVQVDQATVTYSNVEGGAPGTGNFDADALFLGPIGGDYHVAPGSPCIDAGTPGLTDPDGSPLDVGAHPYASFYARRDVGAVDRTPGWSSVSAELGGEHALRLVLGPAAAGDLFVVLGSATGTAPSTPVLGAALPLVVDGWTAATLLHAGSGPLVGTLGALSPAGSADASLVVPPAAVTGPASLWHAALVVDPLALSAQATNAVEVRLD